MYGDHQTKYKKSLSKMRGVKMVFGYRLPFDVYGLIYSYET